jgi:hypothetical protein
LFSEDEAEGIIRLVKVCLSGWQWDYCRVVAGVPEARLEISLQEEVVLADLEEEVLAGEAPVEAGNYFIGSKKPGGNTPPGFLLVSFVEIILCQEKLSVRDWGQPMQL